MKEKPINPQIVVDLKREYNDKLDILASTAMGNILHGVYSNPGVLAELGKCAEDNKQSLAMEVAERSYVMATVMLKTRKEYLIK